MIEVEQRGIVTEEIYNKLISMFKKEIKTTKQITYYFSGEKDFRLMMTKDYNQLWLKEGKMHDDAREEIVVKIDPSYKDSILNMLKALSYSVKIKWYRVRNEVKYKGYDLTIDYTVGYGYVVEIEKIIKKDSMINDTKEELIKVLGELGITPSNKEELNKVYEYYKENYITLTKNIDEEEFIYN